jgi:hypothetical protein
MPLATDQMAAFATEPAPGAHGTYEQAALTSHRNFRAGVRSWQNAIVEAAFWIQSTVERRWNWTTSQIRQVQFIQRIRDLASFREYSNLNISS